MSNIRDAYNSGVTLREAVEACADQLAQNADDYSPPRAIPAESDNSIRAISNHITNLGDALIEPGRQRNAAKRELIGNLARGEYLGIGFISPREISDNPKEVPADAWKLAKIDYAKSEIVSGSLKFENVRIIEPANKYVPKPEKDNAAIPSIMRKTPGRPSSTAKISAAFRELKKEGKINFSKPMAHAYPIIRERLFEKHGTEKGFKDEAIRLAIRDDFFQASGGDSA